MSKSIRFPANEEAYTSNAVLTEHLEAHIHYNEQHRFGQSIFIDDVCVYQSFVHSDEDIKRLTEKSRSIGIPKHQLPYI